MGGVGASLNCIPGTDADSGHRFDQRPGDLEATRGAKSSGNALISIIGTKKADGWRAAVEIRGPLNAEQLRMLADEARRFADLFDERVDW